MVGGIDTLNEMEKIEVDNRDRPIEDIVLQKAQVFVDPFQEVDEQLAEQRAAEIEAQRVAVVEEQKRKQRAQPMKVYREGVGKYLSKVAGGVEEASGSGGAAASSGAAVEIDLPAKKVKRSADYRFKDFSSW